MFTFTPRLQCSRRCQGLAWVTVLAAALALALSTALAAPGGLDPTFGNGGVRVLPRDPGVILWAGHAVVVQADGKLVVATTYLKQGADAIFVVYRFLPNGGLDLNFGPSGGGSTSLSLPKDHTALAV